MRHIYSYKIQYQEVDADRRLRLYTLENYLLNVGGRAADDGGFGTKALLPYGYTWIITRLNLTMDYIPTHGDIITIESWVEHNAHMLSIRDYRIYLSSSRPDFTDGRWQEDKAQWLNNNARLIGQAKSTWAVLDLEKREIVNAFDLDIFNNVCDPQILEMPKAERLTPILQPTGSGKHTICYSDVDYNGHCNSCKYLEWMLNTRRINPNGSAIRLDINYVKEIHLGEVIETIYLEQPDSIQYQQKNEAGQTCCSSKMKIF